MITSQNRTALFDHTAEPIPAGTLGYIRARSKRQLFSLLIVEFEKSGIPQAQLARRLNMDRALLSRYLGTPANWQYETLCDFFFAISGAVINPKLSYPSKQNEIDDEIDAASALTISENEIATPTFRINFTRSIVRPHHNRSINDSTIGIIPIPLNVNTSQYRLLEGL